MVKGFLFYFYSIDVLNTIWLRVWVCFLAVITTKGTIFYPQFASLEDEIFPVGGLLSKKRTCS